MLSALFRGTPGPKGRSSMSCWIRVRVQMAEVRIRLSESVRAMRQRMRFSLLISISSSSMSSDSDCSATRAFRSDVVSVSNGVPSAAEAVRVRTLAFTLADLPFVTFDLWSPQAGGMRPALTSSALA